MKVEPIPESPACTIDNTLVISDLHLGIERSYKEEGIRIPTQTKKIKNQIKKLTKKEETKKTVLLGDVKNQIPTLSWQERNEIPKFLRDLSEFNEVIIIPGNHDGKIQRLLPKNQSNIQIKDNRGIVEKDIYLSHGHTWPKETAFNKSTLLIGHNHPIITFEDELGRKHDEKCWIRTSLKKEKIFDKYGEIPWNNPELIIQPAFNPLVGGISFNSDIKNFLGPLFNLGAVNYRDMVANLVDGAFLGKVERLDKVNQGKKDSSE
ncbi:hypothetical protein C9439_06945 [archaeon SCG-AAA382B04]|nr:hypothetical protein C9439_06945 [archaeon SCG-AAA382B04]